MIFWFGLQDDRTYTCWNGNSEHFWTTWHAPNFALNHFRLASNVFAQASIGMAWRGSPSRPHGCRTAGRSRRAGRRRRTRGNPCVQSKAMIRWSMTLLWRLGNARVDAMVNVSCRPRSGPRHFEELRGFTLESKARCAQNLYSMELELVQGFLHAQGRLSANEKGTVCEKHNLKGNVLHWAGGRTAAKQHAKHPFAEQRGCAY